MKIEIRSTTLPCPLEKKEMRFLGQVLNHAAAEEGVPDFARVTLLLTDNENIQRFNSRFRHIEQPTDVLSFPMYEERAWQEMPLLPGLPAPSLGDIIISLPRCEEQAEAYGHSFQRELCFLALHGFLHLLGYDHMEEAEAAVMEARAKTYLHAMGVER